MNNADIYNNMVENESSQRLAALPSENTRNEVNYQLRVFQSSCNLLAHVLIGFVVGGALIFVFRGGVPTGSTPIHITLCVLGVSVYL